MISVATPTIVVNLSPPSALSLLRDINEYIEVNIRQQSTDNIPIIIKCFIERKYTEI
jgi:hypothetical protein